MLPLCEKYHAFWNAETHRATVRHWFIHMIMIVNVEWESRAIFLTIYDDLYKTYLWGTCITLNLFVALTAASESIYDVINMAAI